MAVSRAQKYMVLFEMNRSIPCSLIALLSACGVTRIESLPIDEMLKIALGGTSLS